jgi:hypothetical protein
MSCKLQLHCVILQSHAGSDTGIAATGWRRIFIIISLILVSSFTTPMEVFVTVSGNFVLITVTFWESSAVLKWGWGGGGAQVQFSAALRPFSWVPGRFLDNSFKDGDVKRTQWSIKTSKNSVLVIVFLNKGSFTSITEYFFRKILVRKKFKSTFIKGFTYNENI